MQNDTKILSLLGLASRARKVVTGDVLMKYIRSQKVECVFLANDASENTKKKYLDKCSYYHIPIFLFSDVESLSKAIGKENRVCVGISDKGFAIKIKSMIGG